MLPAKRPHFLRTSAETVVERTPVNVLRAFMGLIPGGEMVTKSLDKLLSGVVPIPVVRLGIGVNQVSFTRLDTRDSSTTPLFVSFGEDLPVGQQVVAHQVDPLGSQPGR